MISIITTVKNGSKYILETLDSVRNQSFTKFEHIIIDDGSTDNTIDIIKSYKEQYPNYDLRLFETGGLGRGKALNYAISQSKSDWIAIIDADDIWHPKKLEIQYKIVSDNNIDVLATESGLFKDIKEISYSNFPHNNNSIVYYRLSDLLRRNRLSHSSVLIRKALCSYDEHRKSQFDYELWLRLAEEKRILAKSQVVLNFHRIHANQSFEGKMKKAYRWRSFKLKASKCISNKDIKSLVYNSLKLIFDLIFPRDIRFKIKEAALQRKR